MACCSMPLLLLLLTVLCRAVPCHVLVCCQCELLSGGVDVLVATPGRLLSHHQRGSLNLSNTAALVLDEVDVLAGRGL